MLDVCLLGTGGMMPLPYRWLTALMTRFNGSNLLIDCGEGTQITIKQQGWSFKAIDTICFTHYHGDHVSGLPGLLLTIGNSDRTEPVTLIGPKGLERVVSGLRVIAPELPYELRFIELRDPVEELVINGYHIKAFRVSHKVVCYGYTLSIPRQGRFDTEKAKEAGIPIKLWNRLQKGETLEHEGRTFTPEMVLGPSRKGIQVSYCTDTRPVQSIPENVAGSDLFICEGMYGEEEDQAKAKDYKHMTMVEAANLAKQAQVEELWLTHYSPALVRPGDYMDKIRKIFPNSQPGTDRKTASFKFEDD